MLVAHHRSRHTLGSNCHWTSEGARLFAWHSWDLSRSEQLKVCLLHTHTHTHHEVARQSDSCEHIHQQLKLSVTMRRHLSPSRLRCPPDGGDGAAGRVFPIPMRRWCNLDLEDTPPQSPTREPRAKDARQRSWCVLTIDDDEPIQPQTRRSQCKRRWQ